MGRASKSKAGPKVPEANVKPEAKWLRTAAGILPAWAIDDVREMSRAPRAIVVILILGGIGGWLFAGMLVYTPQIERLNSEIKGKEGQLSRYRIALGVDWASEGALVELTNSEMKAKAANTASKLREMAASYGRRDAEIGKLKRENKIGDKAAAERSMALMREVSNEFQRTLRADAINVDNELRRRLGPKSLGSIVGLPPTFYSAADGSPIGILGLTTSANTGMDAPLLSVLANGIEQMAQLLPSDGGPKR